MLELISEQRHDFLNHLQVISGLLQLNKGERAREYIRGVGRDIKRLSKIGHLKVPDAAAAFLIGHNLAASHEIEVDYDIQADLKGCTVPGDKLGAVLEKLLGFAVDCLAPPKIAGRNIFIKIGAVDGGYICLLRFNAALNGNRDGASEVFRLAKEQLSPYGARLEGGFSGENCDVMLFLPAGGA
jgi:hypothetical protein